MERLLVVCFWALLILVIFWKPIFKICMYLWVVRKIDIEGDVIELKEQPVMTSSYPADDFNSNSITLRFIPASLYFINLRYEDGSKHLIGVASDLYYKLKQLKAENDSLHIQISCKKYEWEEEPTAMSLI